MHRTAGAVLVAAVIALVATLTLAQTGKEPPQMTPEQKAEMEAYMKAGTPGAPHQTLAAAAGNYDLLIVAMPDNLTDGAEQLRAELDIVMERAQCPVFLAKMPEIPREASRD